jgi:hypothetical protein
MDDVKHAVIERVKVREVAGVFDTREALEEAVEALLFAGIDRADIDVMAGLETVQKKLGGIYVPAEDLADRPEAPRRAFIARYELNGALAGIAGLLTYVGATAAAFAVVASGGALALAVAAAALGGAATGALGLLTARAVGEREAKELLDQLAAGGIVLWVRVRSPDKEEQVQQIMSVHGARALRVHEIELDKRFDDLPLAELRPDPWLGDEPLAGP